MGLPPTGEIVARPMVARACGCVQEFQHYAVDKYRAQRLAKFQSTRCPACVAKLEEQQRPLPKGEVFKLLPPGTQLTLTRQADGSWAGSATSGGKPVEATGPAEGGPQALVVALARQWLSARG